MRRCAVRLLLSAAWLLAGCSSLDTDSGKELLPGNYRLHLPGLILRTCAPVSARTLLQKR